MRLTSLFQDRLDRKGNGKAGLHHGLTCSPVMQGAEAQKLDGPGLLVLDRIVGEPDAEQHYMIEDAGSLKIVPGSALQSNSNCCGRVLYVARPPKIDRLQQDERMGPVEM